MGKLLLVVVRTEWMAYAGHERLFVTDRFRTAKICAYRAVCRSLDSALGDAVRAQIRADTPPRHATRMPTIRELASGDSLHEITFLLHRAYARLGAMGLNYTAVNQSAEVTAERIAGGRCLVAEVEAKVVGTILVKPTSAAIDCEYFMRPGVAAVHQFAVDPAISFRRANPAGRTRPPRSPRCPCPARSPAAATRASPPRGRPSS